MSDPELSKIDKFEILSWLWNGWN